MTTNTHIPVMLEEVLEHLAVRPGGVYWDGTVGQGGHAAGILKGLSSGGELWLSDRDGAAEAHVSRLVQQAPGRVHFLRGRFADVVNRVPEVLDGVLLDVGVSATHLGDPERGFSFKGDGPLDMRMDPSQLLTAFDVVNRWPEKELADAIFQFGEERYSRRIARRVVERRKQKPVERCGELADICRSCYPRRYHRIDPATRTFQALRIVVNDELNELNAVLPCALKRLGSGGTCVVISFHSLEDRIVKTVFREHGRSGGYVVLTKRPMIPTEEEVSRNPASRSAKLRAIRRVTRNEHG